MVSVDHSLALQRHCKEHYEPWIIENECHAVFPRDSSEFFERMDEFLIFCEKRMNRKKAEARGETFDGDEPAEECVSGDQGSSSGRVPSPPQATEREWEIEAEHRQELYEERKREKLAKQVAAMERRAKREARLKSKIEALSRTTSTPSTATPSRTQGVQVEEVESEESARSGGPGVLRAGGGEAEEAGKDAETPDASPPVTHQMDPESQLSQYASVCSPSMQAPLVLNLASKRPTSAPGTRSSTPGLPAQPGATLPGHAVSSIDTASRATHGRSSPCSRPSSAISQGSLRSAASTPGSSRLVPHNPSH